MKSHSSILAQFCGAHKNSSNVKYPVHIRGERLQPLPQPWNKGTHTLVAVKRAPKRGSVRGTTAEWERTAKCCGRGWAAGAGEKDEPKYIRKPQGSWPSREFRWCYDGVDRTRLRMRADSARGGFPGDGRAEAKNRRARDGGASPRFFSTASRREIWTKYVTAWISRYCLIWSFYHFASFSSRARAPSTPPTPKKFLKKTWIQSIWYEMEILGPVRIMSSEKRVLD